MLLMYAVQKGPQTSPFPVLLQFFIFLFAVPVGEAWGDREGVEAEGHSQVTDGQVNNEELGWF